MTTPSSSTSATGASAVAPISSPSASAPATHAKTTNALSASDLETLSTLGYLILPDFLSREIVDELRNDVDELRFKSGLFRKAKIGQDSTNELNVDVRVAETCFIGRDRSELTSLDIGSNSIRDRPGGLYDILDGLRMSLDAIHKTTNRGGAVKLDDKLTELLYAYYPRGGYYRRHRDAVPNSASVLRTYSLLLYLNAEDWDTNLNGGQLRIHLDGGGDELLPDAEPKYVDVDPLGGTLVLFKSDMIPHEVLNTNAERYAIVGWYNRGVSVADIGSLGGIGGGGGGDAVTRLALLGVAMSLVTYGVVSILG